jgi:hypothetical protein
MKKALFTMFTAGTSLVLASAQTIIIGSGSQQGQVNGSALISLLNLAQAIVSRLVPFAVTIAVLAFFWFLIKFIMSGGDPEGKNKSLKGMGLSILALFVMVSIWGIIGLLGSIVGVNQGGTIPIPAVPTPSQ